MIEYSSVVPERENLPYYLISIGWYHKWQKYTGCFKVEQDDEDMEDDSNTDSLILGEHPGHINPEREVNKLSKETRNKVYTSNEDYYGKFYLLDGKKEDQDFKVVDEQVWNKLFSKYGGRELRRKSIAVPTENP